MATNEVPEVKVSWVRTTTGLPTERAGISMFSRNAESTQQRIKFLLAARTKLEKASDGTNALSEHWEPLAFLSKPLPGSIDGNRLGAHVYSRNGRIYEMLPLVRDNAQAPDVVAPMDALVTIWHDSVKRHAAERKIIEAKLQAGIDKLSGWEKFDHLFGLKTFCGGGTDEHWEITGGMGPYKIYDTGPSGKILSVGFNDESKKCILFRFPGFSHDRWNVRRPDSYDHGPGVFESSDGKVHIPFIATYAYDKREGWAIPVKRAATDGIERPTILDQPQPVFYDEGNVVPEITDLEYHVKVGQLVCERTGAAQGVANLVLQYMFAMLVL